MTNEDLIAILSKMKPNAVILINGRSPANVKPVSGKVVQGYLDIQFEPNPNGDVKKNYQGITFTHWVELSDGSIDETEHF